MTLESTLHTQKPKRNHPKHTPKHSQTHNPVITVAKANEWDDYYKLHKIPRIPRFRVMVTQKLDQ